jgi:DNA polymerase III delta prime subunit
VSALLHPTTAKQIAALREHSAGSVIFHGPPGLGQLEAARELATTLNCLGDTPAKCANCRQIEAGNFPDFILLEPGDKPSLSIERVRGLTAELALRPYGADSVRVVVINPADVLTHEAQNALLKLLEEPPPRTLIILIAHHLEALLVTVRSRCQAVYFVRPDATGSSDSADLTADAASVEVLTVFDRLLLAGRLAAAGADLSHFGESLHRRVIIRLQAGELDSRTANLWLAALERFRLHLRAKVTARVALERLMLELS